MSRVKILDPLESKLKKKKQKSAKYELIAEYGINILGVNVFINIG